jgi:hypothetical protein
MFRNAVRVHRAAVAAGKHKKGSMRGARSLSSADFAAGVTSHTCAGRSGCDSRHVPNTSIGVSAFTNTPMTGGLWPRLGYAMRVAPATRVGISRRRTVLPVDEHARHERASLRDGLVPRPPQPAEQCLLVEEQLAQRAASRNQPSRAAGFETLAGARSSTS